MQRCDLNVPYDGIVLVNKPQGFTSNAVLQKVKRLFGAKKAGHTGSLDPMATGMLPICLGEATKFCQYLLDADKCYEVMGQLGIKTNTGDATGEVIARQENVLIDSQVLDTVLCEFRGDIQQTPSMFSALKHHGVPLYRFARAGIDIAREARTITVSSLERTYFDGVCMHLRVHCSKGTYIRNLVEDIGDRLGVGGHVTALHRVFTAGFEQETMYTLDALAEMSEEARQACVLSMERAVVHFPKINLDSALVLALQQGKKPMVSFENAPKPGILRLYEGDEAFKGLVHWTESGELRVKRLLQR